MWKIFSSFASLLIKLLITWLEIQNRTETISEIYCTVNFKKDIENLITLDFQFEFDIVIVKLRLL